MRACSGYCQQGRLQCPTRQACELPEDERTERALKRIAAIVGAVLGLASVVSCVAGPHLLRVVQ